MSEEVWRCRDEVRGEVRSKRSCGRVREAGMTEFIPLKTKKASTLAPNTNILLF